MEEQKNKTKETINKKIDNIEKREKKKENKKEIKEIEKLQKELASKDEKIKSFEEKLLRMNAEIQNIKRHAQEERDNLIKYEGEDFIKSLLETIDNFERAISLDDDNLDDEVSKFLSGFKIMYTNLVNLLNNYGVKEIDALHKEFDPNNMQAVLTDKNEKFESNIVTEVFQKGYMYKDKIIRPAMVKVNE